jgi:hypothetical protein
MCRSILDSGGHHVDSHSGRFTSVTKSIFVLKKNGTRFDSLLLHMLYAVTSRLHAPYAQNSIATKAIRTYHLEVVLLIA